MGVNAHININPAWKEPAIIWFIVAAKKGEKKTAALRLIRQALEGIEKERIQEWEADISDDKHKTPPQLLVDNFSFVELHSVMKRNGNQILGLFDECHLLSPAGSLQTHRSGNHNVATLMVSILGTSAKKFQLLDITVISTTSALFTLKSMGKDRGQILSHL